MAVAPKTQKKSAAQVKAGQAFAAAGRAAQAKSRAATIAKTGKKPAVSKARHQAALKWAAAGRAAQAAKKAGNRAVTPKKVAAIAPSELVLPGSSWPTGCNDIAPTCAAVAVACHLQASIGITMTDREILLLHEMAGGETGATIESVLEVMHGRNGRVLRLNGTRLRTFFRADEQFLLAGLVVGVKLGHEGHAVLAAPGGMISWGRFIPWDGDPVEAWALCWDVYG